MLPQQTTVAIISDTHSVLHPEICELIKQCDIAIHAGDICDGKILESMQPKTGHIIAVRGNNDHEYCWSQHQFQQLKAIPSIAELKLPGGLIKIEHGHLHDMQKPDHEDLRRAHPEARVIVYGHTHRMVIDDCKQPWVVNPGAAGATRTRGGPACLVLTASISLWKIDCFRFDDLAVKTHSTVSAA